MLNDERRVPESTCCVTPTFLRFPPKPAPPELVVVPGTHQSELGCPTDWQPDCEATALTYDEEDEVWQGTFLIEPDNDQDNNGPRYKVAVNGSWDENYGAFGAFNGANHELAHDGVRSPPGEIHVHAQITDVIGVTDDVNPQRRVRPQQLADLHLRLLHPTRIADTDKDRGHPLRVEHAS